MNIDPVRQLRERQRERSLREFAKEIGVSAQYLCDIFHGRRDPGPVILKYLGLRKIVTYVDE